jgi:hypothetical protein
MPKWDGRERRRDNRLIIELPKGGNLDAVLRLFTTTLGGGLQAIALALSTPQDNSTEVQRRIDAIASELNLAATEQQSALDKLKTR